MFGGVVVVVVALTTVLAMNGNSLAGTKTGATNWVLPPLNGGKFVSLASMRGTPTVVNFFASWCKVCAAELPVFASDAELLRGKVNIVEVNSMETGNGQAFAQEFGLFGAATDVLRDVGGEQNNGLYQSIGGTGSLPMTVFYNAAGQILTTHLGGYDSQTLAQAIKQEYGIAVPA